MGKISLSDIVNLPAFEEAGDLFYRATGMTISFYNEAGENIFYPVAQRCELCRMVQSTAEGRERCRRSDQLAQERAFRLGRPTAYTCHAGLTDVVVPVIVGGERIGCFFSGQSVLTPPSSMNYQSFIAMVGDLGNDPHSLWEAYLRAPSVDQGSFEIALGLLSVICNHLVEGEIALRRERKLTQEQRQRRRSAEEKARLERDLREMEMRLLQAQLNPHFLFNALNLILGRAMEEDAPQTCHLVEELSGLLRHSVRSVGSLVSLADEVASTRSFVDIFSARFGHQIALPTEVARGLENLRVPALILQPLVENALVHALPACREELKIEVKAINEAGKPVIRVSDNGPGLAFARLEELKRALEVSEGNIKLTGLPGLSRRLNYYYPGRASLSLDSPSGSGLVVTLHLPAEVS